MPAKRMKKPATKPAKKLAEPLAYIHESLRPLAEPIDSLIPNPDNPVKHGEEAIAATAKALESFDARGVVVARESDRMIIDGHCRWLAAQRLGWTHLPVIWVDDDEAKAIAYAAASRATVELSEWIDDELLAKALAKVHKFDADMFDVLGLEALCETAGDALAKNGDDTADTSPQLAGLEYRVIVECTSEAHQAELLARFDGEGLPCRALTS